MLVASTVQPVDDKFIRFLVQEERMRASPVTPDAGLETRTSE